MLNKVFNTLTLCYRAESCLTLFLLDPVFARVVLKTALKLHVTVILYIDWNKWVQPLKTLHGECKQ